MSLYTLTQLPAADEGHPLGPVTRFTVADDTAEAAEAATAASGELHARSWIGDETGRLLNVRWTDGHLEAAQSVVAAALKAGAPGQVDAATNAAVHPDPDVRNELWRSFGFELWQEKEGFLWTDSGQDLPAPERISTRTLAEAGVEAFVAAVAASATGTLDGVDAEAAAAMGPETWSRAFLDSTEDATWLLAYDPAGARPDEPVGFVAVHEFDPGVGSITYISVLPGHRGRGYVDDLLRVANRTARELGFGTMLSDSDVRNEPMHAALERNGHHAADTAWHKWMYRKRV